MNNIKLERVSGLIKKEISQIIQFEVKEPNIGFVTVTDVEVTSDYSFAKVYVSIFNDNKEKCLEALTQAKGFIRSKLASRLTIRKCPDLIFVLDNSLENGNRIEAIIEELNKKHE